MPSFRRPPRTLISGLGVAGAVLAAIVVTFALASGIVSYSLTSEDPLPRADGALVLDPLRAHVTSVKPLVVRSMRASAARAHRAAGAVVTAERTPPARRQRTDSFSARAVPRAGDPGPWGDGGRTPEPGPQPAADPLPARAPVVEALGETTRAIGETTDSLARRLHAVTDDLAARTTPIVGDTGDSLRTAVGETSGGVARLLGRPPAR